MKKINVVFAVAFMLVVFTSNGQSHAPVLWSFEAERLSGPEAVITVTADVANGWHLYSQFSGENGPVPTRFIFNTQDRYQLVGQTEESGRAITFYDSIYEMKVTWLSGKVSFIQKIKMSEPVTRINGKIEYMICNNHMCIPDRREFIIDIHPPKKR